jgi:hypothetical protein
MTLSRYDARRIVRAVRQGSSSPVIVETAAGRFLVKLRGAAQGIPPLIAEIIVAELADPLGLPVPERVLVTLDETVPSDDGNDELGDLSRRSTPSRRRFSPTRFRTNPRSACGPRTSRSFGNGSNRRGRSWNDFLCRDALGVLRKCPMGRSLPRATTAAVVFSLLGGCAVPRPGAGRSGAGSGDAAADGMSVDPACVNVPCDTFECGAGFIATRLPGECCATVCIPDDCSTADCPTLACAPGSHPESVKGSCCKRCVKDDDSAGTCEQGQSGYAAFLAQRLASPEVSGCSKDADCRLVLLDNACGVSCGTPASVRGASVLTASADAYADEHCAACPPPSPCPPVERFAVCVGGACSAY